MPGDHGALVALPAQRADAGIEGRLWHMRAIRAFAGRQKAQCNGEGHKKGTPKVPILRVTMQAGAYPLCVSGY